MAKEYFGYTTNGPMTVPAAVGGQITGNVSILADADFAVHYITGIVTQAALVVLNWGGTIQINDVGTGRTFWNFPIGFIETVGTGQQPFPLPFPRLVNANSTLVITLTNVVATATVCRVTLVGYKLRPGEDDPRVMGAV